MKIDYELFEELIAKEYVRCDNPQTPPFIFRQVEIVGQPELLSLSKLSDDQKEILAVVLGLFGYIFASHSSGLITLPSGEISHWIGIGLFLAPTIAYMIVRYFIRRRWDLRQPITWGPPCLFTLFWMLTKPEPIRIGIFGLIILPFLILMPIAFTLGYLRRVWIKNVEPYLDNLARTQPKGKEVAIGVRVTLVAIVYSIYAIFILELITWGGLFSVFVVILSAFLSFLCTIPCMDKGIDHWIIAGILGSMFILFFQIWFVVGPQVCRQLGIF